ncbi:hypothetical protein [Streptomyces coffeae]|uniref:Uncharacterized protein n=1 Tax=Streptomyces coffeae TaxID=621382 RepID=A0ABS1NQC4_9ACTN|nr:hypothetical protein [Streptomyces coffeae]MBL1102272.1 hypothetical protein [Streptomyces coffeae]
MARKAGMMKKFARPVKGLAAVSGALLVGALVAVPAVADDPSSAPTAAPSAAPSSAPTAAPSDDPSAAPSDDPSAAPSAAPSDDPSSAAPSASPITPPGGSCFSRERDVSSTVVDYGGAPLFETQFHAATDRLGHAFLNDSRGPGVWIDLGLVAGAPTCTQDTALSVTESDPGHLFITLLAGDGVIHQARCTISTAGALTPTNIATACAPGFTPLPGTPV